MWEGMFSAINIIAMIGWVLLAFCPRTALISSAVMYLGVGLLCLIYTVCFGVAISGGLSVEGLGMSVTGVRAFFASDAGIVIGWTHYLALDLFTGLWIARDADSKGFGRVLQFPFLFATFMAGPIGLLAWLIMREGRARAMGRKRD